MSTLLQSIENAFKHNYFCVHEHEKSIVIPCYVLTDVKKGFDELETIGQWGQSQGFSDVISVWQDDAHTMDYNLYGYCFMLTSKTESDRLFDDTRYNYKYRQSYGCNSTLQRNDSQVGWKDVIISQLEDEKNNSQPLTLNSERINRNKELIRDIWALFIYNTTGYGQTDNQIFIDWGNVCYGEIDYLWMTNNDWLITEINSGQWQHPPLLNKYNIKQSLLYCINCKTQISYNKQGLIIVINPCFD